ncbi:mannosyl-3-phosphoglycerate phosphatase [Oceanicoccus sp. KOV_DT_Chl]|uniref:HAD-IIB family hydrolase n=1 Tax=Oceanicoccus sp. KOV_DT_Chl TaxID=1904639 RepID=UPI00135C9F36|nr:HAD-IIB family hydrolase [Oceanicoccus sp. KOV_DT_Chl]
MSNTAAYLISTDLDGTLLDHHNYSWQAASEALQQLKIKSIPIVINTSKTAPEVLALQQQLAINDPFIVENGSAVFIHKQDARFNIETFKVGTQPHLTDKEKVFSDWFAIILGKPRADSLEALRFARREFNWQFNGFSDCSTAQISDLTGLSLASAAQAKNRQFSEPLLWQDSEANLATFRVFLAERELTLLKGGRFYHVLGNTNKGKAIQWLQQRMTQSGKTSLIALGDSQNDLDMLRVADYPVLVKSPSHDYPVFEHPNLIKTDGEGPVGWSDAIKQLTVTRT